MGERWGSLRTYCLESSLVGLKYFYLYPDFFSRCFWTLNLVWVVTSSCAITWLLYCRFDAMPTRITIENQFEPVLNLPYPTITLCSPNQMTVSAMKYYRDNLQYGNLTIELAKVLPMLLGFYELHEDINENDLQKLQHILDINQKSIIEVMGKMPLSCDRFLKRCKIEGEMRDCSELFRPIISANGYCCAFNSKYSFDGESMQVDHDFTNHFVKATGFYSSLSIIMDYEAQDAIPNTILNAGSIRVMLTDWKEFPVDYETYLVDSNGEAFLFLRATYTYCSDEVRTLPPDIRKCYFENELKLLFFKHYHNSDCDQMCYVLAVLKTCHCWLFFVPATKLERVCTASSVPCIMDVKKNMASWLMADHCQCPRDCEFRQYRAELTVGNFDAIPYSPDHRNPLLGLQVNASTSLMHFMFTKPVYTKQKQETVMSIINLVSNLGGVFGLFMGCSGISVLEILFHIYKGMMNHIHQLHGNRRNVIDFRR